MNAADIKPAGVKPDLVVLGGPASASLQPAQCPVCQGRN